MPCYQFHCCDVTRLKDPQGTLLPDDAAAMAFGAQIIRELMDGDAASYQGWRMEITTGGWLLASIRFDEIGPRARLPLVVPTG
jgi:hypothetical protein